MDNDAFKRIAFGGLANMDKLMGDDADEMTAEQRQQYKAEALVVLDAARDRLLSPLCDKSPEEKQQLLAEGQRLRDMLAQLP